MGRRVHPLVVAGAVCLTVCAAAGAQDEGAATERDVPTAPAPAPAREPIPDASPYEGRMVREIRFEGLNRVTRTFVDNQLRTMPGLPLSWETVREDLRRLERLGEFRDIQADVLVDPDLNVVVLFRVVEAPIVNDVAVTGNRQVNDQDIQEAVGSFVSLIRGIPIDDYQIGRAQRAIEELYRNKGFYLVKVDVDESELESQGNIIFRVREGERVKVTSIRFEGNESFPARELRAEIETRTSGLFDRGAVDDTVLDSDVAAIVRFYLNRGHLDVRASRTIVPSPNGREAIITFMIEEGPRYTLREISLRARGAREAAAAPAPGAGAGAGAAGAEGAAAEAPVAAAGEVYSEDQLRGLLALKPGDTFSQSELEKAVRALRDAYRKLGYVDANVTSVQLRDPDQPVIDLELSVTPGERFRTGMVYIQGNDLTQQKVIRRDVTVKPDRWLDGTESDETQRRLREGRLFDPRGVKVTIQPEDPAEPGVRDVLVEVEETNTGALSFGAAVSSDAGVTGLINLNQRNFDLADTPDSLDELIRGRAFRGAGQTFDLSIQPGTEVGNYALTITEPYLFETPTSVSNSIYYRTREFDEYDEDRFGDRLRLGRRFGTRWVGTLAFRAESVDVSDIDDDAVTDLFDVEGQNFITSIGPLLTRSTVDSRIRPTRGTYTELGVEQVGAMGGDYSFTKLAAAHQVYIPIDEDYMGNKTVLSFTTRVGYIPQDQDDTPLFERFFLGGRSFRGFRFRGVGPTGVQRDGTPTDDHIGGVWSFFAGAEIEKPLWRDILAVVVFVDSGTLSDDVSFEDYRVSVGTGIRLYIPQFGSAPLAFDFGFPLSAQDSDREQLFSFSLDIPIQ
ncbi:MAG: BamA/TamA family outer membrane protein [Planctomycetota bacterium]|nr:BamA/TamA family outer membrane protein [Planctomycetota bacterium]